MAKFQFEKDISSLTIYPDERNKDQAVEDYSYSGYESPWFCIDYDENDIPISYEIIGPDEVEALRNLLNT